MSPPYTHDHRPTTVLQPVRERVLARFEKGEHVAEFREIIFQKMLRVRA
jgi:hypothetical protein